jgi:hypothetical protein
MQDLDVINRVNAKAVEEHAAKEAKAGKFVLLKFTGLNFLDYVAFDTERERNNAAIEWVNAAPGHRSGHLNPPAAAVNTQEAA